MSNNGVWNEGRAERYGPNAPRQRGDRDRYRYVYWIYTAIRHWMRRAIERVKKAAALRGRYDILGNRGGARRISFVNYDRHKDAEYRQSLDPVVGQVAKHGDGTINQF